MPQVFISYVREDYDAVSRLAAHFERCEIDTWIDRNELAPGTRWRDEIQKAIRSGNFFPACFSKNYASRGRSYVNEELNIAIDERRMRPASISWFIPVLFDDATVPEVRINARETIQDLQWVSLSSDWDDGLHRLVGIINPSFAARQHSPTPDQLKTFVDFQKGGLRALLERAEDLGYIIVSEVDMKDFLCQVLIPRLPASSQRDALEEQLNDEYRAATDEPGGIFLTMKNANQMNRWVKTQVRALTHARESLKLPKEYLPQTTNADIEEHKRAIRSGPNPIVEYFRESISMPTGIIGSALQMPWWKAMPVLLRQERISYAVFKLIKRMAYIVVHVENNQRVAQGINPQHVVVFCNIAVSISAYLLSILRSGGTPDATED